MKTIQDILNQLDVFLIKPKDDFVEVTLPIYLFMNWDLNSVELKIKPIDSGYIISEKLKFVNSFIKIVYISYPRTFSILQMLRKNKFLRSFFAFAKKQKVREPLLPHFS